jgi:DNA transposition AAA+ family ATPase
VLGQLPRIKRATFVETSIGKRVHWACQRAFIRQKIAYVWGESQIGKSTCVVEHQRRNNHGQTYYVEMPPAAGVQLMTREIAKALHVATQTCYEKLIQDVIAALDDSKLLIIDEVHRVFTTYQKTSVMRCLDVLRHIHDRTRCGMVLVGTNVLRDQLRRGEFFQYLKQLRQRGLIEVQLPSTPPQEDLDLMARHFGLDPAKHGVFEWEVKGALGQKVKVKYSSLDVMLDIAKEDGCGKYIIRLQDATELASNKGQKLSWEHFCRAHHLIAAMAQEDAQ